MSDDRSNGKQQDRIRINIHELFDVQYWSKEFEITPDLLKEMVLRLGTSAEVVRRAVFQMRNATA